jgi:glc operon protein GlcG
MRKLLFAAAAIVAGAVSVSAIAQPVYIERKQVSPDAARKMVDACLAFAQQNNIRVGIAVVDVAGVLIDFHAMPGGGATMAETAILKAKTAAHWQRSTAELEEDVRTQKNGASVWIGDFPRIGGLPIVIDGQVAGAIGIGGAAKQEECARHAIDTVIGKSAVSAQR